MPSLGRTPGSLHVPFTLPGGPPSPERRQAHHIPPLGRFPDYLAFHPELFRSPGDRWASCVPLGPESVSPAPRTGHARAAARETPGKTSGVGGSVAGCYTTPPTCDTSPAAPRAAGLFLGPRGLAGWPPAALPQGLMAALSPAKQVVKRVLAQTSSGGFCGNDGFMHMTLASLPFGGVGRCRQSPALSCCYWPEGTPTPPSRRNLPDLSLRVHVEVDPQGCHLGFLAPLWSLSLGGHCFSHQRHGLESAHQRTRGGLTCSLYSRGRLRTAPGTLPVSPQSSTWCVTPPPPGDRGCSRPKGSQGSGDFWPQQPP